MVFDTNPTAEQERRNRDEARLIEREVEILSEEANPYGRSVRRELGADGFIGNPVPNSIRREFTVDPGGIKVCDVGKPRTGAEAEAEIRSHFAVHLAALKRKG